MTLRKREDAINLKRKFYITLCGEHDLAEAMGLL